MSDDAIKVRVQTPSAPTPAHSSRLWRYALYLGAAVLAVLTLAYIDGGEEPLHPIVQSSALSVEMETSVHTGTRS